MNNTFHVLKSIPLYLTFVDSGNREIRSVNGKFTYSLRTQLLEDVSNEDIFLYQNVSFQTCNDFLEKNLYQSIVYSFEEADITNKFLVEFDNNFIVLPNVSEATLLPALHAKLNSICHEASEVDMVSLKYGDGLKYNYVNVDGIYEALPTMESWIGELSFWETPWWFRKDFSTFDNYAKDQEELDEFLNDAKRQSDINEMGNHVERFHREVTNQLSPTNAETKGELVHIDFKNKNKNND